MVLASLGLGVSGKFGEAISFSTMDNQMERRSRRAWKP